eukprot:Phypoly_transcript_04168.p1 GENE.Phypoly_transcript_04168~~Phypoly_transcript_04168.p1  ORF type:complete len:290 (+),score=25.68 Phypoly_transcript_04168:676-1545(+)
MQRTSQTCAMRFQIQIFDFLFCFFFPVLFCFGFFSCFVLFCFVLFCFVLFCFFCKLDKKRTRTESNYRKRFFTNPTLSEGTEEISPNVYHIPFAFKLPPSLPASFKAGDFAQIAYKIAVYADISPLSCKPASADLIVGGNIFSDIEFTTNNPVPVIQMQQMKILWRGTIHGEVTVPKSNYYFGDTCTIQVNTENNSKHLIRGHRAFMQCQITHTANSHTDNDVWKYTETTEAFNTPVPKMTQKIYTLNYILPSTIIPSVFPLQNGNKNITCQCEIVIVFDIKNCPDFEV